MSTHGKDVTTSEVGRRTPHVWSTQWWRARMHDAVFWTDVTQLAKTVLAATLAWVLATSVFRLEQAFLAPWAALLVVNSTVYRTLSQGGRQVAATVLGVLVASAAGQALGLDVASVAIAMAVGLAIGSVALLEGQETTVAATALVVLTTGFSDDDSVLLARLLDTGIGIAVGIGVNLLVWPPLRRRTAIAAMDAIDDAIGGLLVDMADGVRRGVTTTDTTAWVERTRDLDDDLDAAWALVRQARESARLNPRRSARGWRDPAEWHGLLKRMEQAIAECRSLARTLSLSVEGGSDWDDDFRARFVTLLHESGKAVEDADHQPLVEIRERLDGLVDELTEAGLPARLWPEYGGVLINLRNVLAAMDEVAKANPLGQPPLPFRLRPPAPPR
ncbi:FUSC family protein [Nocardioides sp. AX2bis]|uniref:FUSC family protein n=1 Tax=Nocardioides sp. AX2bis TaxID=2653157 RepID=UPI0012EF96E9|nr:aromatic acid exporter family protein [Nocardioides sp. AX2bis]VXA91894.1 conserved membrane hypothetical protein [Nocardioides sp. AX2bis]